MWNWDPSHVDAKNIFEREREREREMGGGASSKSTDRAIKFTNKL